MNAHTIHGTLVDVSIVKGHMSVAHREYLTLISIQMLRATTKKSFNGYLDANRHISMGNSKMRDFHVITEYLRPIDEYLATRYDGKNVYGYIDSIPMVEVYQAM